MPDDAMMAAAKGKRREILTRYAEKLRRANREDDQITTEILKVGGSEEEAERAIAAIDEEKVKLGETENNWIANTIVIGSFLLGAATAIGLLIFFIFGGRRVSISKGALMVAGFAGCAVGFGLIVILLGICKLLRIPTEVNAERALPDKLDIEQKLRDIY